MITDVLAKPPTNQQQAPNCRLCSNPCCSNVIKSLILRDNRLEQGLLQAMCLINVLRQKKKDEHLIWKHFFAKWFKDKTKGVMGFFSGNSLIYFILNSFLCVSLDSLISLKEGGSLLEFPLLFSSPDFLSDNGWSEIQARSGDYGHCGTIKWSDPGVSVCINSANERTKPDEVESILFIYLFNPSRFGKGGCR